MKTYSNVKTHNIEDTNADSLSEEVNRYMRIHFQHGWQLLDISFYTANENGKLIYHALIVYDSNPN